MTIPLNEQIRALSLKEPFASLMLHGKIETRTWYTKYRGLVLICASKSGYSLESVTRISGGDTVRRIYDIVRPAVFTNHYPNDGFAVAIGRLVDCRPMQHADEEKCFVKYFSDLWCHVYENVRPIKPFTWKGSQGWKTLTQEQIDKIELI